MLQCDREGGVRWLLARLRMAASVFTSVMGCGELSISTILSSTPLFTTYSLFLATRTTYQQERGKEEKNLEN
jgi:hypothetical protein